MLYKGAKARRQELCQNPPQMWWEPSCLGTCAASRACQQLDKEPSWMLSPGKLMWYRCLNQHSVTRPVIAWSFSFLTRLSKAHRLSSTESHTSLLESPCFLVPVSFSWFSPFLHYLFNKACLNSVGLLRLLPHFLLLRARLYSTSSLTHFICVATVNILAVRSAVLLSHLVCLCGSLSSSNSLDRKGLGCCPWASAGPPGSQMLWCQAAGASRACAG